jgi:tetratricopeptide (TPR) repeat protein
LAAALLWLTLGAVNRFILFFTLALSFALSAQDFVAPLQRVPIGPGGTLPPDTMMLSRKAAEAFGKKDWNTARAAYQEMLKLDAENALAWANLGAVEQQSGHVKEAIESFEKSVLYHPSLVQSWNALGLLHSAKGDTYLAMSMFTRAIHEDPTDAHAHNYLAISARNLGWNSSAESELQRAIELKPDYGIAHFNLALLYVDQKPPSIELAKRHYQKALALGVEKDEIVERRLKE